MINYFSQEEFEGTFHIEDADLQKMVKVLNDVNIKECPYFDLSDKYGNSARYYRENQWIPCSERLPEDWKEEVLISLKDGRVFEGQWSDDEGFPIWSVCYGESSAYPNEVLAWMPLPEPYKGDEE